MDPRRQDAEVRVSGKGEDICSVACHDLFAAPTEENPLARRRTREEAREIANPLAKHRPRPEKLPPPRIPMVRRAFFAVVLGLQLHDLKGVWIKPCFLERHHGEVDDIAAWSLLRIASDVLTRQVGTDDVRVRHVRLVTEPLCDWQGNDVVRAWEHPLKCNPLVRPKSIGLYHVS